MSEQYRDMILEALDKPMTTEELLEKMIANDPTLNTLQIGKIRREIVRMLLIGSLRFDQEWNKVAKP